MKASKAVKEQLTLYQQWYPNTYQLKAYPLEGRKALTVKNRQEIYQRLMKPQRLLIEKHKKYQMSSFFVNHHHLIDNQWVFETVNIDENYSRKLKRYQLYCECGKAIKYQFILKSQKTNETIALGITHFADHLGVSQEVANEIKKGLNHVDLALDELLWLKDRGYSFPADLWKQYLYALYRNQHLVRPHVNNQALLERLLEFKALEMPIFIADYLAVLNEIRLIESKVREEPQEGFTGDKKQFEHFSTHFSLEVESPKKPVKKYHKKSLALFEQWQALEVGEREKVWIDFKALVEASEK